MRLFVFLLFIFVNSSVLAKVVEQSESHFVISHTIEFNAPITQSFSRFSDVATWWHPDHTFSGDAKNLRFDTQSRCFCETLADGGFVEHLSIVYWQPNKAVVMQGGLGPLQSFPVSGTMRWQFESLETHTKLTLTYKVNGRIDPKMGEWPQAVDGVIGQQLERLKSAVNKVN